MLENALVLDLETQKSFKEVGKSKAHSLDKLKISVVGVYDYSTKKFETYLESDMMILEKRLKDVDLLIGFNIRRFDLPVLAPYLFMKTETIPCLDLLDEVEEVRGHRASLNSIAKPTLKANKSGSGLEAITLFKENRWEELKRYCLDDVRLTRDIYEYGCREGNVSFTSTWDYKTYKIPVRWKEQTDQLLKKPSSKENAFPSSLF